MHVEHICRAAIEIPRLSECTGSADVRSTPDAAERTAKVLQAGSGGNPDRNYWTGAQYAPQGALKQVTLGNALTERWSFNTQRQQPYDVRLGTVENEMSHLTLQFAYCANQFSGGSCTTNNGNVMGQSIGIPGVEQSYAYDPLNRLSRVGNFGDRRGFRFLRNGCLRVWGNRQAMIRQLEPSPLFPVLASC